jgi:hypothetical protein
MLGVIGNRFSIGKETYLPFSAELHYFRIDKRYWSICFERIRRAGFRIIATAVPWNIHQDTAKHIDFSGYDDPKKDLIVFLELAREFGFKVILRPGPMVCGQLPYNGLPRTLFSDTKVFARDAKGAEVVLPDTYGIKGGISVVFAQQLPVPSAQLFQSLHRDNQELRALAGGVHGRARLCRSGAVLPDSADYNRRGGRILPRVSPSPVR